VQGKVWRRTGLECKNRKFSYEFDVLNLRYHFLRVYTKIITMKKVIVLIGAGSIGQAITRRVSAGKHVLLADLRQENADAAAKTLSDAGFEVTTATVDVSGRASVEALVA
jgi:FlaA1/EpsC-like NDP-sugar epimerase